MGALLGGLAMLVVPGGCHVRRDLKYSMQIKENPLGLAFLVENWRALLEPLVLELHHLKFFCQTLNLSLCHLILSALLTLNFFLLKTRVNMISLSSLSFLRI